MDIEIKTWLYDILTAINEIESFIGPNPSSLESDLKTKRAVERDIEIIGEAMNRILQKNDSVELSNARKIVDTRNRIIHGYDNISDEIIKSIILQHLPILKSEVQALLQP